MTRQTEPTVEPKFDTEAAAGVMLVLGFALVAFLLWRANNRLQTVSNEMRRARRDQRRERKAMRSLEQEVDSDG